MNFKCFFGFHDYQPVDGLWWKYHTTEFSGITLGIQVIKLYECTNCKKTKEKVIEEYSYSLFDIEDVRKYLEIHGFHSILSYYADK